MFVTKIKWVVLSVVTLSMASIIIHLSLTKLWTVNIVQYKAMPGLLEDFVSATGKQVGLFFYTYSLLLYCQAFFLSLKHIWMEGLELKERKEGGFVQFRIKRII